MRIELHKIKVRDVVNGYQDTDEEGVVGYGGKLDIRPKYQREFVYKDKPRNAVITTIKKKFPLNVMYWMVKDDGCFEVLDGQQRTISIARYVCGDFSVDNMFFGNITEDERNEILDYELMIYLCEGTDKERLEWFKVINTAGEKLTEQEIRNAVYTGTWLTDAKSKFSKTNCVAYLLASDRGQLMTGVPIRQDYLETVLSWINDGKIEDYMARHQHDSNANELWQYFQSVIEWVRSVFVVYRKEMAGLAWGALYNEFKENKFDPKKLEDRIKDLMQDEDVTKKSGIYEYLLSGKEKYLNIRAFSNNQKREAYERQKGICPKCGRHFDISEMQGDHIVPWSKNGKTTAENCQMLCAEDNGRKSGF